MSVLLYWFGLHSIHRAFSGSSLMDRVSRFALNVFLIGYAFLVVELSVRHVMIHMLAHGVGDTAAEEQAMATTLFAAAAGIHFAFLYVTSIGSAIFGYGLVRRSVGMSIFKLAAAGLSLTGIFTFIVLMIAEHVPGIDLQWSCRCQQRRAALRRPLHLGHRRGNHAGTSGIRGRGSRGLGKAWDGEKAGSGRPVAFDGLPALPLRTQIPQDPMLTILGSRSIGVRSLSSSAATWHSKSSAIAC